MNIVLNIIHNSIHNIFHKIIPNMVKIKKIRLFLIFEITIFILLAVRCFLPLENFYFDTNSFIYEDNQISTPKLKLRSGSYNVHFAYDTQGNTAYAQVSIAPPGDGMLNNAYDQLPYAYSNLNVDKNIDNMKFELKRSSESVIISVYDRKIAYFSLNSITISETRRVWLRHILELLFFSILLDVYLYRRCVMGKRMSHETRITFFSASVIILMASIPLFLPYLIKGHDLPFHLMRIEGIKDGILSGQFPVKIQPNWLYGNGYAVSVFYGDLFLYIPAMLRIIGYDIHFSYCVYVFLVNTMTCVVSYFCFKGMFRSNKAAIVGSALYTLSVYRLINIYVRSSVGEYTAMIFLPLIAYGLYRIFTDDVYDKKYINNVIFSVIGYTGLIQSHIITCELAGLFTILACFVCIKKVFNRKRFLVLASVVILTMIINAGFLVPFIDYMGEDVKINTAMDFSSGIQHYGAYIAQLFELFTTSDGLSNSVFEGISGEMPITIGIALIFCLFLFVGVYACEKITKYKRFGIICAVFAALTLWMSTIYFPWDNIMMTLKGAGKVVLSLQFPWRALTIAQLFLSILACILIANEENTHYIKKYFAFGVCALVGIQSFWITNQVMNASEPAWYYEEGMLDTAFVVGGEYLPDCKDERYKEFYKIYYNNASDGVELTSVTRKYNTLSFSCSNQTDSEGYVYTSILYYSGYVAKNVDTGETLELSNVNGGIAIKIPADTSGNYRLSFVHPVWWKISYVVSFLGTFLFIGFIFTRFLPFITIENKINNGI